MIGKIQSDSELEEKLYRPNFDIHKNGVKVPDDPYVTDGEAGARVGLDQVISELERIADFAKESDICRHLLEIKTGLETEGITAE